MKLIDFKWNRSPAAIAKEMIDADAQLFLANEAKRLMDPYVPAQNMALSQNVRVYNETGNGVVEYMSPYAHYQFEGVLYVDKKTGKGAFTNGEGLYWSRPGKHKKKTERKLNHSTFRHPLATSHWDKAMLRARKKELEAAMQKYLEERKRK